MSGHPIALNRTLVLMLCLFLFIGCTTGGRKNQPVIDVTQTMSPSLPSVTKTLMPSPFHTLTSRTDYVKEIPSTLTAEPVSETQSPSKCLEVLQDLPKSTDLEGALVITGEWKKRQRYK